MLELLQQRLTTVSALPEVTTSQTASNSWVMACDLPLIWERFEEAYFLFNPLSNETHVLNALAVEILEIFQKGATTLPEILHHLGVEVQHASDDATLPYRNLLRELDRFGVITPVES